MRAFAEEYKKRGWPLNVLLNNAAIQSPKGKRGAKTEDGFEVRPCCTFMQRGVAQLRTSVLLLLPGAAALHLTTFSGALRHPQQRLLCYCLMPHQTHEVQLPSVQTWDCVCCWCMH